MYFRAHFIYFSVANLLFKKLLLIDSIKSCVTKNDTALQPKLGVPPAYWHKLTQVRRRKERIYIIVIVVFIGGVDNVENSKIPDGV